MYKKNMKLKSAIKKAGLYQWQIAEYLRINECEFSKMWRKEISDQQLHDIHLAINYLKEKSIETGNRLP